MDNQDFSFKKSPARKKIVDLKAVAALLDDESEGQPARERAPSRSGFSPNENLIQETARIKGQRDIIMDRMHKMDTHRSEVAKGVYDKVRRDYEMQLRMVNDLLTEKKLLLKKELKNLYLLREKQIMEINRHQEIREEARFRNILGEFTEDQYQEVDEYETREIEQIQNEHARLITLIKVHEDLFDPEDLGFSANRPVATPPAPPAPPAPTYRVPVVEGATRTYTSARSEPMAESPRSKTFDLENTPLPTRVAPPAIAQKASPQPQSTPPPVAPAPIVNEEVAAMHEATQNHIEVALKEEDSSDYILQDSQHGYFDAPEPSVKTTKPDLPVSTPVIEAETHETVIREKAKKEEPESIFDILEDIPLDGDPLSGDTVATPSSPTSSADFNSGLQNVSEPSATPLVTHEVQGTAPTYKIFFVDGAIDMKELLIKDNVSIGRSPSNDIVLNAPKVSRQHAAINKYKDRYIIIDLKSSNGVFINGQKVEEHTLQDGDEISIADFKMIFKKIS